MNIENLQENSNTSEEGVIKEENPTQLEPQPSTPEETSHLTANQNPETERLIQSGCNQEQAAAVLSARNQIERVHANQDNGITLQDVLPRIASAFRLFFNASHTNDGLKFQNRDVAINNFYDLIRSSGILLSGEEMRQIDDELETVR